MSFTDADTTVNPHSHKGGNDMSNYNGYLLKFGNNIMPNKYITAFSSTPNQRLETSAERDQNGTLQRATLSNYKTKISFSTHILHLDFVPRLVGFKNRINICKACNCFAVNLCDDIAFFKACAVTRTARYDTLNINALRNVVI